MPSKFLSGTASYAAGTRTITGATMNPVFASSDVGKGVVFRAGSAISWSRVASFISTTSVSLAKNASLPSSNVTIDDLILLDLGEQHVYDDYLAEIDAKIKDEVGSQSKLSPEDRKKYLRSAVTNYGRDKGHKVKIAVTGDGTDSYSLSTILGNNWVHGYTTITEIEYPSGEKPPAMLESNEWEIYDDGSAQDGSNLKLRFTSLSPASTESFIVTFAVQFNLPEIGQQNFPDTNENFENVTTLAAAYCCFALAAAYAPSTDSTISADVINYHDKSRKYTDLGRTYLKRYFLSVFGEEEPPSGVSAAFVDIDQDAEASHGGDFLFHSRRFR